MTHYLEKRYGIQKLLLEGMMTSPKLRPAGMKLSDKDDDEGLPPDVNIDAIHSDLGGPRNPYWDELYRDWITHLVSKGMDPADAEDFLAKMGYEPVYSTEDSGQEEPSDFRASLPGRQFGRR